MSRVRTAPPEAKPIVRASLVDGCSGGRRSPSPWQPSPWQPSPSASFRSQHPFEHGWWLVAYLALVGALSQLILGAGQLTLAADLPRTSLSHRTVGAELVLWNVGAVVVPVGVLTETPTVVAAGSVVLLAALALFASTEVSPARRARDHGLSLYAYRLAVILLAASVVVGTGLADALPWQ